MLLGILRRCLAIAAPALLASLPAVAGTVSLAWDPAEGASAYRIYYGTASGQYPYYLDVANVTEATVDGLADCTTWYLAIKGRNAVGQESADYSNEVVGWPRPRISAPAMSAARQGAQVTLQVPGANFQQGAAIDIESDNLLVYFETPRVIGCNLIEIALTVSPTRDEPRPAQVGTFGFTMTVTNPDQIYQSQGQVFQILMDPARFNVSVSDENTRLRLDEADLALFSKAFGSRDGDGRYDPDSDFDGDGSVDGADLAYGYGSGFFGKCWTGAEYTIDACPTDLR